MLQQKVGFKMDIYLPHTDKKDKEKGWRKTFIPAILILD